MSFRLGFAGITGKMTGLCIEQAKAEGLTIAGGTMRPASTKARPADIGLFDDVAALAAACDAIIDFTHADAVVAHAKTLEGARCAWVIGASGVTPAGRDAIVDAARARPVFYAANFSRGMNVVLLLAERLAQLLPYENYDAEVVDIFHRRKVDAPSGTAIAIGEAVARGRGQSLDQVKVAGRQGDIGARKAGEIGFSSLRGGAVAGENSLIMTGASEQTSLTHRVANPRIYAKGAIDAARWVVTKPPGLYAMKDMIGELNA